MRFGPTAIRLIGNCFTSGLVGDYITLSYLILYCTLAYAYNFCMCLYIYIYIYMCVCVYIYTHMYIEYVGAASARVRRLRQNTW